MHWYDTLLMSLGAIRGNRLRSALTLSGIVLGVASIIGVMTGIAVIQATMEAEMSVLGAQTFQVQKWPAGGFTTDEQRRIAMRRPPLSLSDADAIRRHGTLVDLVGSELWEFGSTVRYGGESTEANINICGGDPQYPENNTHFVATGRNLAEIDLRSARRVAVIGAGLAERFFPYIDPVGREIQVDGRSFEVIGVFAPKKSAFGGGYDNYVLMPHSTFVQAYGPLDREGFPRSTNITVRARSPQLVNDAIEETRQILRRVRSVAPGDPDNFEFFNSDSLIETFNKTTLGVRIGAFVLGIIALVVAGVGIMNIMLVSVTERTREIGIRMSIGARRSSILRQFLLEAVILCNVGGLIGILLGFALGNVVAAFAAFEVSVPVEWAVIGLLFCSAVGIGFGLMPAMRASRLDPVEALRHE
ncbi:MAG: FtsX-like permease family protein [Gammaproteobacteria bacterium]|nr:MAG: FtsX-like permease family protein [Gammaproteobacteria bacterium]